MRFVVERDVLAEAVAWVARSLPTRPVLPVLSGLLLEAAPDGLSLACYDYEVSARIRVPADVAEAGTALVPGRLLAEITRSLPALAVEFSTDDDVVKLRGDSPEPRYRPHAPASLPHSEHRRPRRRPDQANDLAPVR